MSSQSTNLIVEQFQNKAVPPLPPYVPDTPESREAWEKAHQPPPVEPKPETPQAEPTPSITVPPSMVGMTPKDVEKAINVGAGPAPDPEVVNRTIEIERQQFQQFEDKLRRDDPYLYDVLKSTGVSVNGVRYEPG